MEKYYSLAAVLALPFFAVVGCDKTSQDTMSDTRTGMPAANTDAYVTSGTNTMAGTNAASYDNRAAVRDVDNSGINQRDRDTNNLTPGDQGNSQPDIDLTQKIRKALVMDTSYSTTAKNIKIITANGHVTLRGPVNSDSEKLGIESLAKSVAGDGNVDDQLETKSNP
jgi:hyperosmotically inducible protein